MNFLSYGKQWIDEDDINAVVSVLNGDYLTQGPAIDRFEADICKITGAEYSVAVSNATAALHIAVEALEIEKGSSGITSPNTFVATSNSLIYNQIIPEFADIDTETFNLDPAQFESKISCSTKVVLPVHFAGQPCDMKSISEIASKKNIHVIEDAAHAIGSRYENGKAVGCCEYSDMTIFSFHPVKTIATGEGGAITTNSKKLYDKLRLLRSHGITRDSVLMRENPGPWYYEMIDIGYNFRITDMQAALGSSQLKKLDFFVKRRRDIIDKYNKALSDKKFIVVPYEKKGCYSAFHLYVLQIAFDEAGTTRKEVMEKLKARNIGTQVHYIPVHTQPFYQKNFGYKWGDFPNAENYYANALSIPLYPKLTDEEVEYIIRNVLDVLK